MMVGSGKRIAMMALLLIAAPAAQAISLPFHRSVKHGIENTDCLTSSYAPAQTGMETITNTCTFPLAVLWASSSGKGGLTIAYWDASTPWRTGESHVQSWQFGTHDDAGKDRWRIACDLAQPVCMAAIKCLSQALQASGPLADPAVHRDIEGDARRCNAHLTSYSSMN